MIFQPKTPHEQWLERIQAALVRARLRAREIARQSGTQLVYLQDGKIVREHVTESSDQKFTTEG